MDSQRILKMTPPLTESPPHDRLSSRSFLCLLAVQFLTVLNDHTFRWLVVPIAKPLMGEHNDAAALSLGLAAFTVPYLLVATFAGYLADHFRKTAVIRWCKFAEILVLSGGMAAVVFSNVPLLFGVLGLTGVVAALFAPSKLGCIPEIVRESDLSNANGWMGLMNVVPCALGFLLGNYLAYLIQPDPTQALTWAAATPAIVVIVGIALAGFAASFGLKMRPPADPERKFDSNLVRETLEGFRILASDQTLYRTACGIAFFWMLASLATLNVDQFGILDLGLPQQQIGILGATLVLGVGFGSLLAGLWSAHHIELGLVPIGALGMAICSMLLCLGGPIDVYFPKTALFFSCLALLFLGVSAGLFDVPLEAYLQHRADSKQLGVILAATNVLTCLGILAVSGLFWFCLGVMGMSPGMLFLLAGLSTIPVLVFIVLLLPGATTRLIALILSRTLYHVRITGKNHIPQEGGVLLVPNHVTWVDGILLLVTSPRPIRFVIYADYVNHPKLRWLAKVYDVIPIKATAGPKALIQSLKTAREAIEQGHVVCIFAEGTLTRTGQLQPFQPGFLKIIQGTSAPVIPVCLHGLWGSIFSFRGGKFFWKWPRQLRYPVSILFGKPIYNPPNAASVRFAIQELGAEAMETGKPHELNPPQQFLRACRKTLRQPKVADSTGMELTGGRLLAATLAFRRVLRRNTLASAEKNVGVFLPPTVGGALANLALSCDGRVAVNLNYTLSDDDLKFTVREAGLKHIITSRKMLEKRPVELDVEWVFLEDLKQQVTKWDRLAAAFAAFATPLWLLERQLGLHQLAPDDLLTVIFTSGSTGEPKGVMLSQHNIAATVDAADQLFQINQKDVVLGVIPHFHSLGYVATLWLPMCLPTKVVYHINPLDARTIGELAEKHHATILFATPTFLRTYLKRCTKEQFHKLDLAVVGAEKLQLDLAQQFHEKFGVYPTEGYGATENSGPAAVNVPDHRCDMVEQKGTKPGTVGRPMPGMTIRAKHPDTGEWLSTNVEGLIQIKGPNIMLGYLNRPEKTAEVIQDGWYNTGDMGFVDDDGFVHITGRLSRFSKLAGEMVPHLKIEEIFVRLIEVRGHEDPTPVVAVTALPDEKKGERLIVLHKPLGISAQEFVRSLVDASLPNLWIPSIDSFYEVPEIPLLGTGKLDLKGIRELARSVASNSQIPTPV